MVYATASPISRRKGGLRTQGIFDNAIGEVDRADYPTDRRLSPTVRATASPRCRRRRRSARSGGQRSARAVAGNLRSRSLRYASRRARGSLDRIVVHCWRKSSPLYTSLQREALRSRKTLAKALLQSTGTVSPGDLLAPQLQDLGLRWDGYQFPAATGDLAAGPNVPCHRAIAAAVERRAKLVLGTQGVVLEQQILFCER